ncbi:hypothetical protein, partial [Chryseobacterium sp.]|uniref:hypothetical protein n=1 Tax=Chryseobacterium sp. TaxID=1871047 RepID=UPI0035C76209
TNPNNPTNQTNTINLINPINPINPTNPTNPTNSTNSTIQFNTVWPQQIITFWTGQKDGQTTVFLFMY